MKRLLLQIFAWLDILVGAGLMLQPTVSQYLTRRKSTAAVETFVQSAAVAADDTAAENTRPYADLYDALQAYNAEIYAEGQSGLKDPFAYETPAFDLTAYGLPDDMIAALWVPRLDLDLPVYLGASTENMARGDARRRRLRHAARILQCSGKRTQTDRRRRRDTDLCAQLPERALHLHR